MRGLVIDIANGVVHTEDGQTLAITNAFDACGCECDLDDAESVVAGPDADGMWLSLEILATDYEVSTVLN